MIQSKALENEWARDKMVASPRLTPTEERLDEVIFGPIGAHNYAALFYALNGGPVVVP